MTHVVTTREKGVQEARLRYRVLDSRAGLTLVRVQLLTGRTHQIRVQFAARGCPLAGDGKYGGKGSAPLLWSYRLSFPDPRDGRMQTFEKSPENPPWEALFAEKQQ